MREMRAAAVYSCKPQSNSPNRESLIYEQLDQALSALADLDHHVLPEAGSSAAKPSMPGLGHVRAHEAIVALGSAAHTVLADFQKRTLMTGDLDLEGGDASRFADDIEQFVWSCSNTMGIVALGAAAWSSVQLLPVADRRFHLVPPLRLNRSSVLRSRVFVIDHEKQGSGAARDLVQVLGRSGLQAEYWGADAETSLRDACWSDDALIHVHVGGHTLDTEELRLVDSWASERLTIQLVDRRGPGWKDDKTLMVENEVNGIKCASPEEVVAACHELLDDRVLRQKLISAGRSTVAPLTKTWSAVAEDLLA